MPDQNILSRKISDCESSGTSIQTSSYETELASSKTSSSEDDLYEASVNFLRQHLKRKSVLEIGTDLKLRKYSDTLLFEFVDNFKVKIKFLKLQNVREFSRVLEMESTISNKSLTNIQMLPAVKTKSNISNLFKSKYRNGKSHSEHNNAFLNILRKLSPKNSKEDIKSKSTSDETINIPSNSPTITSNSSFPSIVATIPSKLVIERPKCFDEEPDNTSRYVVTNVWPPKNVKATLTDIEESPRKSSLNETSIDSQALQLADSNFTLQEVEDDDVKLDVTYKNNLCLQYSDSESDFITNQKDGVKRNSSKLSVCTEASDFLESDSDYTDWSSNSEDIDSNMLSPSPVDSKVFGNDPNEQISVIINNLITQLKERNINCL